MKIRSVKHNYRYTLQVTYLEVSESCEFSCTVLRSIAISLTAPTPCPEMFLETLASLIQVAEWLEHLTANQKVSGLSPTML